MLIVHALLTLHNEKAPNITSILVAMILSLSVCNLHIMEPKLKSELKMKQLKLVETFLTVMLRNCS